MAADAASQLTQIRRTEKSSLPHILPRGLPYWDSLLVYLVFLPFWSMEQAEKLSPTCWWGHPRRLAVVCCCCPVPPYLYWLLAVKTLGNLFNF